MVPFVTAANITQPDLYIQVAYKQLKLKEIKLTKMTPINSALSYMDHREFRTYLTMQNPHTALR